MSFLDRLNTSTHTFNTKRNAWCGVKRWSNDLHFAVPFVARSCPSVGPEGLLTFWRVKKVKPFVSFSETFGSVMDVITNRCRTRPLKFDSVREFKRIQKLMNERFIPHGHDIRWDSIYITTNDLLELIYCVDKLGFSWYDTPVTKNEFRMVPPKVTGGKVDRRINKIGVSSFPNHFNGISYETGAKLMDLFDLDNGVAFHLNDTNAPDFGEGTPLPSHRNYYPSAAFTPKGTEWGVIADLNIRWYAERAYGSGLGSTLVMRFGCERFAYCMSAVSYHPVDDPIDVIRSAMALPKLTPEDEGCVVLTFTDATSAEDTGPIKLISHLTEQGNIPWGVRHIGTMRAIILKEEDYVLLKVASNALAGMEVYTGGR